MNSVNRRRLGHVAHPPRCGALGVVLMRDTKGPSQPDQIISEHNFWSYLSPSGANLSEALSFLILP